MKPVSTGSMANILQRTGLRPVVVVSILWGHDLKWYTTRRVEIPGMISEARILGMGDVQCQRRTDHQSTTGSINLDLDDSDGAIKFYVDNVKIERTKATAWLWLEGTHFNDRILLLDGELTTPGWDDNGRKLSVTLEAIVEKSEIGFAPTQEDFKDLSQDVVGTAWPLAFGTVKNLPAVRVRQKTLGILMTDIKFTLPFQKFSDLNNKANLKVRSYLDTLEAFEDQVIYVADYQKFVQGKSLILSVDGVLFKGQFNNSEKFTVEEANISRYPSFKAQVKPSLPESETVTTGDPVSLEAGLFVARLDTTKISLTNLFCYYGVGSGAKRMFNFCVKQIGRDAYFKYPFINPATGKYFNGGEITIYETYATGRTGLSREDVECIWARRNLTTGGTVSNEEYELLNRAASSANSFWRRGEGTSVSLWDLNDPDIYIVSAIKMASIDSVYSKKTLKLNGKQRKVFARVPKAYYEKQLASNYNINNQPVSGLIVHTPLSEYQNQDWEDQLYISGTSTVGPNPIDIIKWVLENHTDLHLDGSFSAVRTKLNSDPAHFALFDRRDALKFAQEIAWQCRCVLIKDSNIIGIRYLGEAPLPIMIFNESNIEEYSMRYGASSASDIVTRMVGTWTDSYKDSPQPQNLNITAVRSLARVLKTLLPDTYKERTATHMYTYTENVDDYGLTTEETNVFIFNNEASVKKTIDFWGHRAANIWKTVSFNALNLDAMALQPYDGIAISVNVAPTQLNVIGLVEAVSYSQDKKSVVIDAWLPIIEGTQVVDGKAYG